MASTTLLGPQDLHLFNEGTHLRLFDKLGARPCTEGGQAGARFAVWAPDAESVHVVGDFNGWDREAHRLEPVGASGIWSGFIPGVKKGSVFKYHVASRFHGYRADKADPFALYAEVPPRTGSVVWDLDYTWRDSDWMKERAHRNSASAPMSIYEMHLGSWRRIPEEDNRPLTYRELAPQLAEYVRELGFTHVEFLPVMEHPFYGSWGYQCTGFFAPTSRYGTPEDFMFLIDTLHQAGIGVILDWVPSHFPKDEHGPGYFDGTHLFEHADPRQGLHPDWDSLIFNYGRNEVRSFLLSSALFWLEKYHVDGLRVDAVASMLYLDYSREDGEWIPNKYGGRENLDAIDFLRRLNTEVYGRFPDTQTIAEESTAWPMVSRPTYVGGLGFGMKWDMGWMHDTLVYMGKDPVHRRYHHDQITFRLIYAFHENFVLPLSHDEVVHGKGSLLGRMPGDHWQKLANLRLLLGSMYGQSGKKLLFMGGEFGQWDEWNHEKSLDWHLTEYEAHRGIQRWVRDLNALYQECQALQSDFDPAGFEWVDCNDADASIISFLRKGTDGSSMLVIANFTPVPRMDYAVGVSEAGFWKELLNSDSEHYGGSGLGNGGGVASRPEPLHGRQHSIQLVMPPLSMLFLSREG
jgi:1,4-alpha-glucan branching enzyme